MAMGSEPASTPPAAPAPSPAPTVESATAGAACSESQAVQAREAKLEAYRQDIAALEARRAEQGSLSPTDRAKLSKRNKAVAELESGVPAPETGAGKPGPEGDGEVAVILGAFFGGLFFPLLAVFSRRFWAGTLDALTREEEVELGRAFVPWARRFPPLLWIAKWCTAPVLLVRKVREKFRPLPDPEKKPLPSPSATGPGNPAPDPPSDRSSAAPELRALPGGAP
jgi:hypothetical protein